MSAGQDLRAPPVPRRSGWPDSPRKRTWRAKDVCAAHFWRARAVGYRRGLSTARTLLGRGVPRPRPEVAGVYQRQTLCRQSAVSRSTYEKPRKRLGIGKDSHVGLPHISRRGNRCDQIRRSGYYGGVLGGSMRVSDADRSIPESAAFGGSTRSADWIRACADFR